MRFNTENCIYDIDNKYLHIFINGECRFEQKTDEFLFYSLSRPFEIENCEWKIESEAGKDEIILSLVDGVIEAKAYFSLCEDVLRVGVSYKNISGKSLNDFTAGVKLYCLDGDKHKVTVPHMIYNDNPSADPDRIVPHIGKEEHKGIIVEENRLPVPAVNIEWKESSTYSLTLLMKPEVKDGYDSEYWSMGVLHESGGECIAALSGPLMFNGMKDVYYGGRNTPLPYLNGYRKLMDGEILEKTFYIGFCETVEGRGFRELPKLGYKILKPEAKRQHSLSQMIEYKKNVMDSRYYEDDKCCGYLTFGAANTFGNVCGRPEYFLYGWTGQAIKLAWCDCMCGFKQSEQERIERAIRTVDFFVKNAQADNVKGLISGYYMIDKEEMRPEWKDASAPVPSRIEGEALIDLIDLIELLKENSCEYPEYWETFVRDCCDFLSQREVMTQDGIYPVGWNHDGSVNTELKNSAGVSCVVALAMAGSFFDEDKYINRAKEIFEVYYELHMKTFDRPFARATMDARCEDKESGIYVFKAASYLYKITGQDFYKECAAVAADWLFTFIYFWNTGFQPGTICHEKKFDSTGWPGVSVQNHHLDVFFPTYEMYEYGSLSNQPFYCKMAEIVCAALTYGIAEKPGDFDYSVIGEQGEQYYQTNYFQVKYPKIIELTRFYRGGMQVWNPSWITAQVLQSSLHFYYNSGK